MPPQSKRSAGAKSWMAVAAIIAAAVVAWAALSPGKAKDETLGKAALQNVTELVNLGPRPSGSEAHKKMQAVIIEKLKAAGLQVEEDHFIVESPIGPLPMNNITGRIAARAGGASNRTIILATHYETKPQQTFRFVGANDAGSGTGLLLALAPLLAKRGYGHNVWLAFLDGEEAVEEAMTETDSLYGSKHLAEKLKANGTASQIGAFILLDMIGDADLNILKDSNSTAWLRDTVWNAAGKLGYSRYFMNSGTGMFDDHIPFVQAGIPAVDLIDYDYGPSNTYWHTAQDTVDKLSAHSLQVVGDVVLETLSQLDKQ